ncbi:MAG: anthranilate synthase component I family protein [Clostridiales bacterium]|jgi:anthranilate synthase component 1|nr:anthranilate synthase component I family protein [Clostridiales bacterium]
MREIRPSLKEAESLGAEYKTVPVSLFIPETSKTPADVFLILKNISRQCFVLESLEDTGARGRYTFLGYDPKLLIDCINGELTVKSRTEMKFKTNSPSEYIKRIIDENKAPKIEGFPPFCGGLVGYFSYDYIKYAEPSLNLDAADEESFKDFDLMLFDKVAAFDRLNGGLVLTVNIRTGGRAAIRENYNNAVRELRETERLIEEGERAEMPPLVLKTPFSPLFSKEEYSEMVKKAKRYIKEGDIFQVVLSNRIDAEAEGSLFGAYLTLRESNPSPYMFYFSSDDLEIAGASPETLVKLCGKDLYTFPLAGTRKRGSTYGEDEVLERELLSDPKELAEHNMLVDLGRNDIGKISEFSTVSVVKYMSVERFSHVMHIGSTVTGRIKDGLTAVDAIDAVLPAGTLSGAPKIRACEIINELENNKRGIYGGAIGYIAFTGDMDTCIAIRIAFKKNGKVFVRSGAGIVADSVPENEYAECVNKAKAVIKALGGDLTD